VSGKPTEKIPPSALMALTPSGAPIVTSSLTLANLLAKGKRVTHADLARLLATIGALYTAFRNVPAEFQSATNAPVPVEVLAMIGKKLAGPDQWAKIHNTARAETAGVDRAQWQRKAEEIWRRHPHLSKSAVAKKVATDRWKTGTVRKFITKPPIK
jgi:hypothetical protein